MLATATWIALGLYAVIVLLLVIRAARRTRSMEDFAVGSLLFSPPAVALSLAASMTSAATFVINPGFVAMYGYSAVISFGFVMPAAALVSLVIFSNGFRRFGQSVQALTMAQWIGKRYGSTGFALGFAFLSLLLITFIVLICVGMAKVLSAALGLDEVAIAAGVIVFVFGYMMFGGANSMVYTNMIQALLMVVVAGVLLGSGGAYLRDGFQGLSAQLAAIDPGLVRPVSPQSPLFRDYFEIIFCQAVIGIAIVCQPHILTKSLLLKTRGGMNQYLALAIVVQGLFFLVVCTGLFARLMFPDLSAGGAALKMDEIIPRYVVERFAPAAGLLVVLGLLSAGISTLEGLIQSVSTTITSDILTPLAGKRLFPDESRKILANRAVIALLAGVSFLLSRDQLLHPNLSVGIFAQNGVYAYFSAAFVPVLLGMFRQDTPPAAAIAASVTAVVVHFGAYYGGWSSYLAGPVRNPAVASTYAILAALAVGLILYFLLRRRASAPVSAASV